MRGARWTAVGRETGVFALFLLLAAVQTGIGSGLSTHVYPGPDPRQDVWVLDWVSSHLTDPAAMFEGNTFFPSRYSVLYCDPLVGPAALVAPLRLLTANPVLVYNLAVLLGFTLSSYGCYRLAKTLWGCAAGALLAGVVVPYCALQMGHRTHLNLLTIAGLPFGLLGLIVTLSRPSLGIALATGGALGLQAATSGYYALIGVLLALIVVVGSWRRLRDRRVLASLAVIAVAAGGILLPYLTGFLHLASQEAAMERHLDEARHYSVGIPEWFLRSHSYLWGAVFGRTPWESLWPGLVPLALAAVGLRRPWPPEVRLLLAIGAVFFLLALGPELQLFGRPVVPLPTRLLLEHVPFFQTVKHPVTFMVPVFLVLGVLAARGVVKLGLGAKPLLAGAVLAVGTVETLAPPPSRMEVPAEAPAVYRLLAEQPEGAVLELPFDDGTPAQWASMFHRRPIVNGRGAFEPRRYGKLLRLVKTQWGRSEVADLEGSESLELLKARYPIRYVVLRGAASGWIQRNLEATPSSFTLIGEAGGDRAYRLRNGGRGAALRRLFREDQLANGLRGFFRGPRDAVLAVTLNGSVLEERRLTGRLETGVWAPGRERLLVGMNELVLTVDSGELELMEIQWQGR